MKAVEGLRGFKSSMTDLLKKLTKFEQLNKANRNLRNRTNTRLSWLNRGGLASGHTDTSAMTDGPQMQIKRAHITEEQTITHALVPLFKFSQT